MGPYLWSVAGLIFDICGGFLLAVEAIKIENIRKLREHYLRGLLTRTTARPFHNPTISYSAADFDALRLREFGGRRRLFNLLHMVPGPALIVAIQLIGLAYGVNPATTIALWIWHMSLIWRVVAIILGIWILSIVIFGLGEMLHSLFAFAVNTTIRVLEAIDRNTPTGTTGILGFVLLFLGFLGQITGTIASAH